MKLNDESVSVDSAMLAGSDSNAWAGLQFLHDHESLIDLQNVYTLLAMRALFDSC